MDINWKVRWLWINIDISYNNYYLKNCCMDFINVKYSMTITHVYDLYKTKIIFTQFQNDVYMKFLHILKPF